MPDTPPSPALPRLAPAWRAVLGPVMSVLNAAIERLELVPARLPPLLDPGSPGGLLLDPALLAAGLYAEPDASWVARAPEGLAPLALDRWRRAAGALLEAVALAALDERPELRAAPAWWRVGRAAEAVDRAAPELGWLWPEAVDLLRAPAIGLEAAPRRAAWLFRWRRQVGAELPPTEPDGALLAAFALWCRDRGAGPAASCPLALEPAPAESGARWTATALSWRAIQAVGGPTGSLLRGRGVELAGLTALATEQRGVVLAAAAHAGPAAIETWPGGPLGTWSLSTGKVQGRVGAARGVELQLGEDGALELVLADAFMGLPTPEMLDLSEHVGVSGHASGRFRVTRLDADGAGALLVESLTPRGLTVHARRGRRFAVPASAVLGPAEAALGALAGETFEFRERDGELVLRGEARGLDLELRLKSTVMIAEAWA